MTLVDRMLNEVTYYAGIPMRRGDIIKLATEHLGEHADKPFGAQYFAMHPPAVHDVEPWDIEWARELMS